MAKKKSRRENSANEAIRNIIDYYEKSRGGENIGSVSKVQHWYAYDYDGKWIFGPCERIGRNGTGNAKKNLEKWFIELGPKEVPQYTKRKNDLKDFIGDEVNLKESSKIHVLSFNGLFELLREEDEYLPLQETFVNKNPDHLRTYSEMSHSNFIAWLLNPREGHGCGTYFLEHFLSTLEASLPSSKNKLKSFISKDVLVYTEYAFNVPKEKSEKDLNGRLDIFIYSVNSEHSIIIENKTGSNEHGEQLSNYTTFGRIKPISSNCTKVVMDIDKYSSIGKKGSWIKISYEWLGAALQAKIRTLDKDEEGNLKDILESYLYQIAEYIENSVIESPYKDAYEKIRNLGAKHYQLWGHPEFQKIWKMDILKLIEFEKRKDENGWPRKKEKDNWPNKVNLSIIREIFSHEEIFSELMEYGILEHIKERLKENFQFRGSFFTLAKIKKNEEGFWPISIQIYKKSIESNKNRTGDVKEVLYDLYLIVSNNFKMSDPERQKLKRLFMKETNSKPSMNLTQVSKKLVSGVEIEGLFTECEKYSKILESVCLEAGLCKK